VFFWHKVASGVDVGNLVASGVDAVFAHLRSLALRRVLHCKVEFRGADRTVMAASGSCLQSWLTQFFCDLQGADRPVELLRPADVSRNRTKSGVSRVIWWSASKIHLGGGGLLERRAPPCHELVRVRKLKTMVVPGWTRWFLA